MKIAGYIVMCAGFYHLFRDTDSNLGWLLVILGNLYVMQGKTVTLSYGDLEKQLKEKNNV